MSTIDTLKEQEVTETPLLLFDCELVSGVITRWSTHRVEFEGNSYEPRVIRHNLFEIKASSGDGIDGISRAVVSLANADSYFSQIERSTGWRAAKLTVRFAFYDLKNRAAASEAAVIFYGVTNPPEELTESTCRLSFSNRLSLQRVALPSVRIQKRCPWAFPATPAERAEAVHGGNLGSYSPFYACGYSPDIQDGVGNLNGSTPFTSCDYTRQQCEERGMFSSDSSGNSTARFGGIGFVPASTLVRGYGEKQSQTAAVLENQARYNDFVPMVYGTGWYNPAIIFAKNDGNLTRMEVLLGLGPIENVVKVVVNEIEIPAGVAGSNMTATGWYNVVSSGWRTGGFNFDFADAAGQPLGDPHGSMAVLSVVVPNRISEGKSLPRVQVLLEGTQLMTYTTDGDIAGLVFTSNPAWVLLDILRRTGWRPEEVDIPSFAHAAAFCDQSAEVKDPYGNPAFIKQFDCNLILRARRSAADLVRGIRVGSSLYLTSGLGGRLRLAAEGTFLQQQPLKPPGSNSTESMNGGWSSYEFGDGSTGVSGILRRANGSASIRVWSRSNADSPNRYSLEFQDALNEYQQDSLSLVDVDDVIRIGQEVGGNLNCLGVPNFVQAERIIRLYLNKSLRGNLYVEFETSVKGVTLNPGDLITLTYLKEGFTRQPFRVLNIAPGADYAQATITAQIHDDTWYTMGIGGTSDGRRQPGAEVGLPRPLVGTLASTTGESEFGIAEQAVENTDGSMRVSLSAEFFVPAKPTASAAGIPLVGLAPGHENTGGSLKGDQSLYYALSGIDAAGIEGGLSFIVRCVIPPGTDTNKVTLMRISASPGTVALNLYRGPHPGQLLRVASSVPVSTTLLDDGLAVELAGPPDENFDHANFYWRLELQPETSANVFSNNTIGNSGLGMLQNEYRGKIVRITNGRGIGQENGIIANDATSITTSRPWVTMPDATSEFVVTEAGWNFGALTNISPSVFEVPNYTGATIQISGRAANVHDRECSFELSPLTRYVIGGAGAGGDLNVSGPPSFGLFAPGDGRVDLIGIGFNDLANTQSIAAGTLTLHYWNELSDPTLIILVTSVNDTDTEVSFGTELGVVAEDLIQIDSEVLRITEVFNQGLRCGVERGSSGSLPGAHAIGAKVYRLERRVFIAPFPKQFFGSPASGSYSFSAALSNVRIAAAELTMTNNRGSSDVMKKAFTNTVDAGLRTLSGGQFAIQIEGPLAIQTGATPPLIVEAEHCVRDVFARLREPATSGPVDLQLRHGNEVYCTLTIPIGLTESNVIDGFGLPPLRAGGELALDVLSVGQSGGASPGRDLTVTLRL